MLLRAAFGIALVALLAPHAPDFGLGVPAVQSAPAKMTKWLDETPASSGMAIQARVSGETTLDRLQAPIVEGLDSLTARMEEHERRRAP